MVTVSVRTVAVRNMIREAIVAAAPSDDDDLQEMTFEDAVPDQAPPSAKKPVRPVIEITKKPAAKRQILATSDDADSDDDDELPDPPVRTTPVKKSKKQKQKLQRK